MSTNNNILENIQEEVEQSDVTVMNSYLEVDVAQWFSDNKIPYGYEPFMIPSVVSESENQWNKMIEAIHGASDPSKFTEKYEIPRNGLNLEGEQLKTIQYGRINQIWNKIYDKHGLADEDVEVPVSESLERYGKKALLPDFVLYRDSEDLEKQGKGVVAGEDFDYGNFTRIIEVSGLWGVGLEDEATKSDWWSWYRVSAVAMKELAYKLLGLWDKVLWILPEMPETKVFDNEENFIVFQTTQFQLQIPKLKEKLGIFEDTVDDSGKLSPNIELIKYDREANSKPRDITPTEYIYAGINRDNLGNMKNAFGIENNYIVFAGDLGEVYITDETVQVRENMYKNTNMLILREYIMDVMSRLSNNNIVEGLSTR